MKAFAQSAAIAALDSAALASAFACLRLRLRLLGLVAGVGGGLPGRLRVLLGLRRRLLRLLEAPAGWRQGPPPSHPAAPRTRLYSAVPPTTHRSGPDALVGLGLQLLDVLLRGVEFLLRAFELLLCGESAACSRAPAACCRGPTGSSAPRSAGRRRRAPAVRSARSRACGTSPARPRPAARARCHRAGLRSPWGHARRRRPTRQSCPRVCSRHVCTTQDGSASCASTAPWTLPWMWSAPIRSMTPSASSTARTCGFTRASRSVDAVGFGELVDLPDLRRALGVDEVDALEIEHERAARSAVLGQRADAILERFGGGEEEAAVEAQDHDARERLVGGVLVEVAEHLGPRLAAEQRHRRPRRDVDEPDRATATTPITTPASTPTESTPTIAATATQKSKRVTR